ncbi:MAG TPA: YtxH domain-containing protein [Gemmatimonadales bacterium]|nr:YtxH domain-containing protein [Gemmatimonadales bacterium]
MNTQDELLQSESKTEIGRRVPGQTGAGFLAGLLFGAFLGAGVALFLATDRGGKSSRQLRRRMRSLREGALDSLDEAGSRTRKELQRRKKRLRAELERIRQRARERAREMKEAQEDLED